MRELKVKVETVTPLFLGGADNKTPELRPPPFRGLMRYWFRALAGGLIGDSSRALEIIRHKEAEIFGSPDEKHGQSAVWVRLSIPGYDRNYTACVLPHRGDTWTNHRGKELRNRPQPAIPPGVSPTLTLTLKPKADTKKLEMAAWSLLVGLTLGGVGKRSRRGFGSLRIVKVERLAPGLNDNLQRQIGQAAQPPSNGTELAQHIGGLLREARSAFTTFLGNPATQVKELARFSVLKSDTPIVVWTPPNNSIKGYETVLSPLMKELSSLMREKGEQDFAQAFGGIKPRRASPLWVSTHRLQDSGYGLVLTHLRAQYPSNRPGYQHQLVADFLNSPPSGWAKTEVQR